MQEPQSERNTMVRHELWVSMVSLFRSHLATLEMLGSLSGVKIDEPFDNEVFIGSSAGVLSIWLNTESGEGSLRIITASVDAAEPWSMSTDGTITMFGESLDDMEIAVELVVATLMK